MEPNKHKNTEYILMHLDHPVLSFDVDKGLRIISINNIYDNKRIPISLFKNNTVEGYMLDDWFNARSISEKRTNFKDILKYHNARYKKELYFKDNSVSVCDCYWIQTPDENKKWKDINFYNSFIDFNENIYIGIKEAKDKIIQDKEERRSPNIMSNGNVPKMWIQKNEELYLLKGSQGYTWEEPVNESIVSDYMDTLGIKHVKYSLDLLKNRPFSICKNMLSKGEDLIPAYYVASLEENEEHQYTYNSYIENCKKLGLEGNIKQELDQMLLLDYIISNIDRHWFNFGLIRDAETLQIKNIAPIYDNGLSLFASEFTDDIKDKHTEVESASFLKYLKDNVSLVTDYSLLEHKNIDTLPDILKETHKKLNMFEHNRIDIIAECIGNNIKNITQKYPHKLIHVNKDNEE
jgi:hypothetical protein